MKASIPSPRRCAKFLVALLIPFAASAADIYLAGDSTMSPYSARQFPQQGWGQRLQEFCVPGVTVHDLAIGGRSSKSFIYEGRWQKLVDQLKPGDFVIIAFGHNNVLPSSKAMRTPDRVKRAGSPAEFRTNFVQYAADVRAKGATPVFATSIIHSGGVSVGKDGATVVRASAAGIGPYVQMTRDLAKELNVGLIDLNGYAEKEFAVMGAEAVNRIYIHLKPGESTNYPQGRDDKCHICDKGARWYAQAAVFLAERGKLPIAKLFKPTDAPKPPAAGK